MPNWCVQNWILKGPKKEVQRFCDTVNTCLTQPDVMPNGFGKYWLGNLCVAFGYEFSETKSGLRGNFDPDESCCATLFHPEAEEKPVVPIDIDEETSEVRFSITHAWGRSDWFEKMVEDKFPELEAAWKATDEFGNFHECLNGKQFGLKRFQVDTWGEYGEDKHFDTAKETADYLNTYCKEIEPGFPDFTEDEIEHQAQSLWDKIKDWYDKHEDDYIELMEWKEAA